MQEELHGAIGLTITPDPYPKIDYLVYVVQ